MRWLYFGARWRQSNKQAAPVFLLQHLAWRAVTAPSHALRCTGAVLPGWARQPSRTNSKRGSTLPQLVSLTTVCKTSLRPLC